MENGFIEIITEGKESGCRTKFREDLEDIGMNHCQLFSSGCFGHGLVMGEELNRIKDMLPFCYCFVSDIVTLA